MGSRGGVCQLYVRVYVSTSVFSFFFFKGMLCAYDNQGGALTGVMKHDRNGWCVTDVNGDNHG